MNVANVYYHQTCESIQVSSDSFVNGFFVHLHCCKVGIEMIEIIMSEAGVGGAMRTFFQKSQIWSFTMGIRAHNLSSASV